MKYFSGAVFGVDQFGDILILFSSSTSILAIYFRRKKQRSSEILMWPESHIEQHTTKQQWLIAQ